MHAAGRMRGQEDAVATAVAKDVEDAARQDAKLAPQALAHARVLAECAQVRPRR